MPHAATLRRAHRLLDHVHDRVRFHGLQVDPEVDRDEPRHGRRVAGTGTRLRAPRFRDRILVLAVVSGGPHR